MRGSGHAATTVLEYVLVQMNSMGKAPAVEQSSWRMPVTVALMCTVAFLATANFAAASGDVTASNVLAWQLATTGDPTFREATYPPLNLHPGREIWVIDRTDGNEVIGRSPGTVIAAIPAYLLFGQGAFSVKPGALTAALLAGLAVWLLAGCLHRMMPSREASLAALVFALSTPVWTVAANQMWPHTITVVGICGMCWAAVRERWWLMGAFGGVVLWGRLHAAVIVAIVGLLLGWRRRDARLTLAVGLGSGLLLALQAAWTKGIYGSWNPLSSYETSKFGEYADGHRLDMVNQLGFWISPDRGFLVWTPIVLVVLPALVSGWRDLPDWSRAMLVAGVCYTIFQGLLNRFSGGDSFYGYRLTLELLACSAPALALSALRMGRWARFFFAPVLALQGLTILPGAVNERLGSPAEEVWTTHSFFSGIWTQPFVLAGFLVICLAASVLGRRIWAGKESSTI